MSQHRTIALSANKLVRTCFCHLGWCRDRFHLVPLLASASVPRRLSRAGTSFTLHYNNVFVKRRFSDTNQRQLQWQHLHYVSSVEVSSRQRFHKQDPLPPIKRRTRSKPGRRAVAEDG
eukprot:g12747.t1